MGSKFRQWKGLDSIFIKDYDAVEGNLIHTYIIINCLPLISTQIGTKPSTTYFTVIMNIHLDSQR